MERTPSQFSSSPQWLRLLSKTVREARLRRGMTQSELGAPMLTKGFISQLENGVSAPSLESLFHIADKLGTSPARLLAASEPDQFVTTTLDMAEAALVVDGPDAAGRWVARLAALLPDNVHVSIIVENAAAENRVVAARLLRYRALSALAAGHAATAIRLLNQATETTRCDGRVTDRGRDATSSTRPSVPFLAAVDDDHVTRIWLGTALVHAKRYRQALHVWEALMESMESAPNPFLRTITMKQLAHVYEQLGDVEPPAPERRGARRHHTLPSQHRTDASDSAAKTANTYGTDAARATHGTDGAGGNRWADAGWLWTMARAAYESRDLSAASAYAWPIPLLGTSLNAAFNRSIAVTGVGSTPYK